MEQTKKCSKCGEMKAPEEFGVDKTRADSLSVWCKLCKCTSTKNWVSRNYDRHRENVLRWKSENRPKVSEQNRRRNKLKKVETAARNRRNTERLTDGYVAGAMGLKTSDATPELIALKREQLAIKRMARELKKAATKQTGENE